MPSLHNFKAIIRMNAIRNNLVTFEDVQLAEHIFGLDIGSIKGKGAREKTKPVVSITLQYQQQSIKSNKR